MSEATRSFDFRNPSRLPIEVESRLLDWQARTCRLMSHKWSHPLAVTTTWETSPPEAVSCGKGDLPEHFAVARVSLAGVNQTTLLAMPSELAVALVQTALGQSVEALDQPRELTSIELSILEVFFGHMIDAMNEGGGGVGYPECTFTQFDPQPLMLQIFPAESELNVLQFHVTAPFGTSAIRWVWPASVAEQLFLTDERPTVANAETARQLEDAALQMPFQLSVELGVAKLHITELANLKEGDVLVLNQRISEPLKCKVAQRVMMRGWPTTTGSRQSIQIAALNHDE
jgi:flagellar motor switch protein FliM